MKFTFMVSKENEKFLLLCKDETEQCYLLKTYEGEPDEKLFMTDATMAQVCFEIMTEIVNKQK